MEILELAQFPSLVDALKARGYQIVGPALRQNAVVYDYLDGMDDLAIGWTAEHGKATYRIRENGAALFGHACGPRAIKHFLIPPRRLLYRARGNGSDFAVELPTEAAPRLAFVGVRACDLAGVALQDRVLAGGAFPDREYRARREQALFVGVNCHTPSANCFCSSMGTGPALSGGFDIALTEVLEADTHYFTAEPGTDTGAEILNELSLRPARPEEIRAAEAVNAAALDAISREVDTSGIHDVLYAAQEGNFWDRVAERCMSCANCTMVCPTCFCATVEDTTDISGETAERWRVWDSCFTTDFSYIHGGAVRKTGASRYRQWLTHKFAAWQDQFGDSGCVGCGRCITWCPGAIDVTEELAALRKAFPPAATA